jgi:hypothetical protein
MAAQTPRRVFQPFFRANTVFLMILKAVFLRHIPFSDLFLIRGNVFSFVAFSSDVFPYRSCSVFPIQPA